MNTQMSETERDGLLFEVNRVFNPSAPVEERALFAGRVTQIEQLVGAISQRGQHVVIHGERGVGKTSLANMLTPWLEGAGKAVIAPRVNADSSDTFSTLWRKMFSEVHASRRKRRPGFERTEEEETFSIADDLPSAITPDDVRRTIADIGGGTILVMIIDEFDQLCDVTSRKLFSETIKTMSDHSVPGTIALVGVANDIEELIQGHQSIERALVQIHLERMTRAELEDAVRRGLARLDSMTIADAALAYISSLSQGLPYYTHMLALHSTKAAVLRRSRTVELEDIQSGIRAAIENTQQSIRTDFHKATSSPQKPNLYTEVLLACALAPRDEMGYFTPAEVRTPVQKITGKPYDIPNFIPHMNAFCDASRGPVLHKAGVKRRFRYRFRNPLMQPFVILRGVADGRIPLEAVQLS